ncbi:MAG TPA: pyrroline-5-carboxylate reductase [Clostridiales bacterium]|nr:pyrroline-5-carboxylate reductase [Clostridiales bacterium]
MNSDFNKIGFIGAGNMATAIITGLIKEGINPKDIYVHDIDIDKLNKIKKKFNIIALDNNVEILKKAKIIFLAVKPHIYPIILDEIKNDITDNHVLISMAAGISTDYIYKILDEEKNIIRIMPNTPALIGEGVIAMCPNKKINSNIFKYVKNLLSCLGEIELIDESLINAVTGVSGSGPAYVFMFIEALADGGVLMGLSREQAYRMAAQTLIGAAKMYMETKTHPGELKDMVCSPGGTTIEAVYALEKHNFRASIIEAVKVCTQRGEELSK